MKDKLYLSIAREVSKFSKCLKGNFGAVIVKNDMILGSGYNGPARGVVHCNPCRRANSRSGEGYEKCIAVHAEENAIIQSGGRERCLGASLYLASHNRANESYNASVEGFFPCNRCARLLVNSGVYSVIFEVEGVVREFDLEVMVKKGELI
jgi:dCMP deaminase